MIEAKWTNEGLRFTGQDLDNHGIIMDSNDGIGPKPMQLLLMSLIGCTGMDAMSILQKKRQIPNSFKVVVENFERAPEHPKVYTKIDLSYIAEGDIKPEALRRSVDLSQKKHCSISEMMRRTAEINYKVILNGEEV